MQEKQVIGDRELPPEIKQALGDLQWYFRRIADALDAIEAKLRGRD